MNAVKRSNADRGRVERFRKRRNNFYKKAHGLATICGVEVYVLLKKDDKYYTFNSSTLSSWPPSKEEIDPKKIVSKTSANFANNENSLASTTAGQSAAALSLLGIKPPTALQLDFGSSEGRWK